MTIFIDAEPRFLEKKSAVRLTKTVRQMERVIGFRGSTQCFYHISEWVTCKDTQDHSRIRLPIQTSLSRLINAQWYLIDDLCNM